MRAAASGGPRMAPAGISSGDVHVPRVTPIVRKFLFKFPFVLADLLGINYTVSPEVSQSDTSGLTV